MRLAKRLAFLGFDLIFGIVKGEQPLTRCGESGVQRSGGGIRNTPPYLWPCLLYTSLRTFQSPWAARYQRMTLTLALPGQVRLKVRSIPVRDAAPCLNALEQKT